jgi:hypothetical protein
MIANVRRLAVAIVSSLFNEVVIIVMGRSLPYHHHPRGLENNDH